MKIPKGIEIIGGIIHIGASGHSDRLGALGPYHIRTYPRPSLPAKPLSRGGIPLGETEKYRGLDGRGVAVCEEFPPPEECDPVL